MIEEAVETVRYINKVYTHEELTKQKKISDNCV